MQYIFEGIFLKKNHVDKLTISCLTFVELKIAPNKKNSEKCHLFGEFSRISGLKKSFAVCTTVVQSGILRLINYMENQ